MNKLAALLLGVSSLLLTACAASVTDESAPDDDEEVVGTARSAVVQINNQTITSLCIDVSDKSNAETTDAIELDYLTQSNDFWSCTLPSGAARGQTSCCTPTRTWKNNTDENGYEFFYVQFQSSSSTDGLRVGGVSAYTAGGTTIHYGTFMKTSTSHLSMYDCDVLEDCSSFSIDGDGSPSCWKSKLELDVAGDARAYCISN